MVHDVRCKVCLRMVCDAWHMLHDDACACLMEFNNGMHVTIVCQCGARGPMAIFDPNLGIEGRSRFSDRSSKWKIGLKIETSEEAREPGEGWSEGGGSEEEEGGGWVLPAEKVEYGGWFFYLPAPKIEDRGGSSFFGAGRTKHPFAHLRRKLPPHLRRIPHLRSSAPKMENKQHLRSSATKNEEPPHLQSSDRSSWPEVEDEGGFFVLQGRRSKIEGGEGFHSSWSKMLLLSPASEPKIEDGRGSSKMGGSSSKMGESVLPFPAPKNEEPPRIFDLRSEDWFKDRHRPRGGRKASPENSRTYPIQRRSTGQQPETKSGFRPADIPDVNRLSSADQLLGLFPYRFT